MRIIFFSIVFLSLSKILFAQEVTTFNKDSSVTITRDTKYNDVISKMREQNTASQTMRGYRIQIYFGGTRQKASEIKLSFNEKHPDIPAYITYQQPNFKVRIGDYRTRFEAQKFLKEIAGIYPTSFIVPDDVKLPPIR